MGSIICMTESRFTPATGQKRVNTGDKLFERVSRWVSIKTNHNPNKRNSLWDYVTDGSGYRPAQKGFNPEDGLYLNYFTFHGRNYAVEQFLALNSQWEPRTLSYVNEHGDTVNLAGIDSEELFDPLYLEADATCEHVRLYKEVTV